MALSRLLGGWLAVIVWLLLWEVVGSRLGGARGNGRLRRVRVYLVEALLLTLLGALWFASLGAGAWWMVFGLVGALREWPATASPRVALLRVVRTVVAGGLLAWRLGPA
ncbi:MAG TPA: hypothetical protein VG500_02480 [Gemmatimonadales bacterium]|jgi:hypothetical protein|nr:hypothetical protein [Gemmatimonadales bacterium]